MSDEEPIPMTDGEYFILTDDGFFILRKGVVIFGEAMIWGTCIDPERECVALLGR